LAAGGEIPLAAIPSAEGWEAKLREPLEMRNLRKTPGALELFQRKNSRQ